MGRAGGGRGERETLLLVIIGLSLGGSSCHGTGWAGRGLQADFAVRRDLEGTQQRRQRRAATPGWLLGPRGVAGCCGEEARRAREKAGPLPAADVLASGSRGAAWSVAGVLGVGLGLGRKEFGGA